MKKFLSALAGVALMVGATSCSDDNNQYTPAPKGEVADMTITVNAPDEFRTRAHGKNYGDGATNTLHLSYTIYRSDGQAVYASTTASDPQPVQATPGQWTISGLKLATQDTYSVVFWADQFGTDAANPYTLDMAAGTLKVDYSKSLAVENLATDRSDAYILYTDFVAQQGMTFTMKRPFCQVNIGSNEDAIKKADGYYHNVPTRVWLGEGGLPNCLNYKTGKVSEIDTDAATEMKRMRVTHNMVASSFDDKPYDFPVNPAVQYMYMAYILAPQTAAGWADGINVDELKLNFALGMTPDFTTERTPFSVAGIKDKFLANTRIIIAPSCTDLGGENPDPDPDPVKPGLVDEVFSFNVIFDAGFGNTFTQNVTAE